MPRQVWGLAAEQLVTEVEHPSLCALQILLRLGAGEGLVFADDRFLLLFIFPLLGVLGEVLTEGVVVPYDRHEVGFGSDGRGPSRFTERQERQ